MCPTGQLRFAILCRATIVIVLAATLITGVGLADTILVPEDFPTIGEALGAAVAGDSIVVACGIYPEKSLAMTSGVVLRSATGVADCVTIDAEAGDRILSWYGTGPATLLEGMTLINALGAIGFDGAEGEVRDCVFRDNTGFYGGGMELRNLSTVAISDCVFDSNTPAGDAAISISSGTVTAARCEFTANSAFEGAGAIWLGFNGGLDAIDCLFQGNHSTEGGTISGLSGAHVQLERCSFLDNSSDQTGGGISMVGTLAVRNCLFRGNTGINGSGINASADSVVVEDSAFFQNTCTGYGAAILSTGSMMVSGCTLVSNRAETFGAGVAVQSGGSVDIDRTVIAHSTLGGAIYCDGESSVSMSCSVVFGNLGGDWVGCLELQLGVRGNTRLDPLLCDVAGGDLTAAANSPLLPAKSLCGQQIGAFGQGCGAVITAAEPVPLAVVSLDRNHPNPFNPSTTIPYFLPLGGTVRLVVYDVRGHAVRTLIDGVRVAGQHEVEWDGRDGHDRELASGVYLARLEAGGRVEGIRMVLLR